VTPERSCSDQTFVPKLVAIRDQLARADHVPLRRRRLGPSTSGLSARSTTSRRWRTPTRDADFEGRSADDLYSSIRRHHRDAKGVMWRHEDIFFGAFGGGGVGDPISTPEEIAQRARAGATRCLAGAARSARHRAGYGVPHPSYTWRCRGVPGAALVAGQRVAPARARCAISSGVEIGSPTPPPPNAPKKMSRGAT